MGTKSLGHDRKKLGGGATKGRPTQPKDTGQEAHNRGSLEDDYR
jgi:hypothetical protein